MTLSSTATKSTYNGDGATTAFATGFRFLANSHVTVILRDENASPVTETTWVEGTHYTLTGAGVASGGTVTVATAPTDHTPAVGEKLIVKRAAPETQGSAFPAGGAFPSATVEQALDLLTMLVQQHSEEIARALILAETSPTSGITLPEPAANALLAWNAAGGNLENKAAADVPLTAVTAFVQTLLDDADAAAARGTLGAGTLSNLVEDSSPRLGGALDTNGKAIQFSEGAAVASAATTDIWGTDGQTVHVTGAAAITAFGTATRAGDLRFVVFDGAATLTHGAGLVLPGSADITTAAGDSCIVYADTTTQMRVVSYQRASGEPVAAGGIVTAYHRETHSANTALATAASGGTLIGNSFPLTIPTAGFLMLTLHQAQFSRVSGASTGPSFAIGIEVNGTKFIPFAVQEGAPVTRYGPAIFFQTANGPEDIRSGSGIRYGGDGGSTTVCIDIAAAGFATGTQMCQFVAADTAANTFTDEGQIDGASTTAVISVTVFDGT